MSESAKSMPGSADTAHDRWPAFVLPWDDTTPGPTDISFLLEKPAGSHGFVRVRDGHLVTGDDRRWRIWGVNITFGDPMPSTDEAPLIARRLAKFGVNCIRLHHMDRRWPNGLIARRLGLDSDPAQLGRDDEPTRSLDPEALARLDYFIYCCKQEGIYTDLNLNVSRLFSRADGVKQAQWLGYGKALTYFDPQLIRLQKEYAVQLLGHTNPFTGNRYAEEPAVALVELVNENSILESWTRGRLRGQQQTPFGAWGDIPPAYAADLDRLWNDWLTQHYPDRAALAAAWAGDLRAYEDAARGSVRRLQPEDFAATSVERFRSEATFYAELERRFFLEMAAFLRGEVGVRQPILGTSDHNHGWHGALHVQNNSLLDVIDGHCYWQHPRYGNGGYSQSDWTITNTPMVDAPDHSAPAQLARSRVLGMPYIVSEVNQPFPNDYAAEFIPILTAYGLLQDWDGIFFYCYGAGQRGSWQETAIPPFFPLHNDPVKMPQLALSALAWLRGDVQPGQEMAALHLPHELVLDSLRGPGPTDHAPYPLPWLPGRLALTHQTAIADFEAATPQPEAGALTFPDGRIVSDTGELVWVDGAQGGHVLVDTPRYQAVVGRCGRYALTHIAVAFTTPFAAVQVASLDGLPIAESARLMLVAGARVANTGMRWADADRRTLGDGWGHGPARLEPVAGTLALQGMAGVQSATLQPLDPRGQAQGAALPFTVEAQGLSITLPGNTAWYMIALQRHA